MTLVLVTKCYSVPMFAGWWEIQMKAIRRFVITEKAPTRAFSWLKDTMLNRR